jgi:AAA+ ATPase superfamily predicted ATPase
MFVNRQREIERIQAAFAREKAQLIVLYGRRRCGKSALLRRVLPPSSVYFSADLSEKPLQIAALAKEISRVIPGFASPVYPTWESLFSNLNQIVRSRTVLCIDEFPYLVKHDASLPSVLQHWIDHTADRKVDLVLCGSSQRMMHNLALDAAAPLYGRCNEILKIRPMAMADFGKYSGLGATQAVEEFAVWGGVPRYWEIRMQESSFEAAVKKQILDPLGLLYEEPERLFLDELRTATEAFSILELIGAGCNRLSEIAARLGKPAPQLTRSIALMQDLGFIKKHIPFGENPKNSKRGIYKLDDDYLRFFFHFVTPWKSAIEFGLVDKVWQEVQNNYATYAGHTWEKLCRELVHTRAWAGESFEPAQSWWGKDLHGRPCEIDIVATNKKGDCLLLGEAKWSDQQQHKAWAQGLDQLVQALPFAANKRVIKVLFTKHAPSSSLAWDGIVMSAEDVSASW